MQLIFFFLFQCFPVIYYLKLGDLGLFCCYYYYYAFKRLTTI